MQAYVFPHTCVSVYMCMCVFILFCFVIVGHLPSSPPPPSHMQYGDDYPKEVESLWSALCTWAHNIRVTINYLARLTHLVGNVSLVLRQAKRIVVCFSRSQSSCVVSELIKDLNVCLCQHC